MKIPLQRHWPVSQAEEVSLRGYIKPRLPRSLLLLFIPRSSLWWIISVIWSFLVSLQTPDQQRALV